MKEKEKTQTKKSFILYNDQIDFINELSNSQAGLLLKALYLYSNGTEILSIEDPGTKMAFIMIRGQIDRDKKKYNNRCIKNKENISNKWGSGSDNDTRSQRLKNARLKGKHTKEEWETLKSLFSCCPRCGGDGEPVKDHIIPIYKGGSDGIDNLQPLCKQCNSQKGPETIDYRPKDWENAYERLRIASTPTDTDTDTDTDTGNNTNKYKDDSVEYRLADYLYNHLLKRNENFKKPDMQIWAKHIDWMIRIDNRKTDNIKTIIEWCQKDTPDKHINEDRWNGWANNILCTKSLRNKFDKMYFSMEEDKQSGREKNNDDRFKALGKDF